MGLEYDIHLPENYGNPDKINDSYTWLRNNAPVYWIDPAGYRPFWAVTKYQDIMEIERQSDKFLSEPRLFIVSEQEEEDVRQLTGGSDILMRTIAHMDGEEHLAYRGLTEEWFLPTNLKKLEQSMFSLAGEYVSRMANIVRSKEGQVSSIAKEFVDKMEDGGGTCDFAQDVAVWYPLRVIMMILGVPKEDEPKLLRLTQQIFGTKDPDFTRQVKEGTSPIVEIMAEFTEYFMHISKDRRENPRDDLSSVIANAKIDGRFLEDWELISYYIIISSAGHETTSSATGGGVIALASNPDQLALLQKDPSKTALAIEEILRWVSPVKHFVRTVTEDYQLRGQTIRKDQAVSLYYASGNRDEDIFERPHDFDITRSPNRHIAFGYGVHRCLGMHLARMEMRAILEQLATRLSHMELLGEPTWFQSSIVNGPKFIPLGYRMAKTAA